jgi:hypothetical protein
MRRSLLAIFRGPDGRSLAWALAFLLIVNGVATGGQIGFAAANPAVVLCTIGDHPAGDKAPLPGHENPCCPAACSAAFGALSAPEIPLPQAKRMPGQLFRSSSESVALDLPQLVHGPRGPPSSA